jgi:hypothetical protein
MISPPPRVGFQMALRTGYMIPFGQVDSTDSMGDTFSGQVPLIADLGWKFDPSFFLGVYGGFGIGGVSGATSALCTQSQVSCVTATLRFGIEAQYHFLPSLPMNPWVGYGIGVESTGFSASDSSGNSDSVAAAGWEFGHFMAGLDFRLSPSIGIGPMIDLSIGQYNTLSTSNNGNTTASGSIQSQALHEWLLIGGRLVIFP